MPAAGTESLHIKLTGVPADRARDALKVAILPLAATGAAVEVDMQITASSENGIPGETLDLTVVEGLRQLGIVRDRQAVATQDRSAATPRREL